MSDATTRLHALVSGRVQGVNFRYTTLQRAQALHLTGWVRNQPDGSVEVMAEGPQAGLEQLLEFLRNGPPHAGVTAVEVDWHTATGEYRTFDVRY
jgi:acylphosphatase